MPRASGGGDIATHTNYLAAVGSKLEFGRKMRVPIESDGDGAYPA